MNKILLSLLLFLSTGYIFAQTGEIQGTVKDDKNEPVGFAQVVIVEDEEGKKTTTKGARADINGRYTIRGLAPGKYNVMAKFVGLPQVVEIDVQVFAGRPTTINFKLEKSAQKIKGDIVVTAKRTQKQIVDVYTPKDNTFTSAEVKEAAVRNVNDIAAATGQVVQQDVGTSLNVAGGRDDANVYFIDGRKVTGSSSLPPSSIAQLEVITSGVPAKYGDLTGGVINITTKGPSNKLMGSIEGLTSQFLDPFGHKLLSGSLSGPLVRRKVKVDSMAPLTSSNSNQKGDVVFGFRINGEVQLDDDKFPRIQGGYKLKDDVYQDLYNNPYQYQLNGIGVEGRFNLLRRNDFERIRSNQNTSGRIFRLDSKFDWLINPDKGINLTFGGNFISDRYNDFIVRYALLNSQNNPLVTNNSYGGFARFVMPLFNKDADTGIIRGATLQLQADYSRYQTNYISERNGFNPFNYGYVGKFEEVFDYNLTQYENSSQNEGYNAYYAPGQFLNLKGVFVSSNFKPVGLNFTPGTQNPLAAHLASSFLELTKGTEAANSFAAMDNRGGIVNGKRADVFVQDVFYPFGRSYGGINKSDNQQFRVSGNVAFDLVNKKKSLDLKHSIEIGFEAEQRINSSYGIAPIGIWQTMNQIGNGHLSSDPTKNYDALILFQSGDSMRMQEYIKQLNNQDAKIIQNGDTLVIDREVSNGNMSTFAKRFRQRYGIDTNQRINFNAYNPNDFSLDMFAADDLLNTSERPTYYGFNYRGEMGPIDASFQDFFTQKDADGNYVRNVAPYRPFYAAGYIQDRFQLKDIAFNLGFRFDYFNSNQFTLKDRYVLNGSVNTNEVDPSVFGTGFVHPTSVGNAVIYVNDNNLTNTRPTIVGYRNGTQWFDARGRELPGPELIKQLSGGEVKPMLQGNTEADRNKRDIRNTNFDPNLIFRPTDAIINIMPRLNFSFKVDSNSLFFAHFDILSQRPPEFQYITTALGYYNVFVTQRTSVLNNPELLTPRTTDLEFGFKQKISPKSSLTINFFYREYTNQVQITRLVGAYPIEYLTYINSDFSTVKGAGLAYELRRTKNLRIKANYTMQFAEGTGSSATSQLSLINAGQGNLKIISPLNFDYRHNINLILDYRFASGKNYDGPQNLKKILENFGVNITTNLRSGAPFTQQANPVNSMFLTSTDRSITLGDINAARMPWQFNVNLKADKDFTFKVGKKSGDSTKPDSRKEVSLNVYLQIRNLLNNENVISVNRFTGDPVNDGYLSSAQGQLQLTSRNAESLGKGESFRDLYNLALEYPQTDVDRGIFSNFRLPRVIQLGAILNF